VGDRRLTEHELLRLLLESAIRAGQPVLVLTHVLGPGAHQSTSTGSNATLCWRPG
jgi:hypothetical protein